jgi:hypothetical protein
VNRAARIDRIGVCKTLLAIDHDPKLVAGIEMIGIIVGGRHGPHDMGTRGGNGLGRRSPRRSRQCVAQRAGGIAALVSGGHWTRLMGRSVRHVVEVAL